ncbi:MAG TPA: Uma2 family endonuclease [Pirellulales bacterium]|nr:Uma2 family endonuclease [Pirellulales bacterium]
MSITPPPGTTADPLYPDSDGQPMGETQDHILAIIELYLTLERHFKNHQDIHVAADLFLYYEQGNPRACKAPDVMVSKGVQGKHRRRSFRVWEEKAVPTVVFEVTSAKTRREDALEKPRAYAQVGIAEYFLFDPLDEYLRPRLQGFRLGPNGYEPMVPDSNGRLQSHELGLLLTPEGALLRLIDAQTGAVLPNQAELENRAAQAADANLAMQQAQRDAERTIKQAQRDSERAIKQAQRDVERANDRAAKLEEELKRLRGQAGQADV